MKDELIKRLGMSNFENSFADLCNHKQTRTIREYEGQFDSGLKEQIKANVQAQRPPTLIESIGLAMVFISRYGKAEDPRPSPMVHRPNEPNRKELLVRNKAAVSLVSSSSSNISHKQNYSKGADKAFCFHYDKPYTATHTWKKLFFIELEQEPEATLEDLAIKEADPPEISLHTLTDSNSSNNVRTCQIKGRAAHESDDSSGEKLDSVAIYKQVSLVLLNSPFQVDFLLLPLECLLRMPIP
ncbi:unnamed protein product [Dovyalis caffra]|uniref:Uncharacterized protein n=1 Tax=Dovyalis caffra TaxID=77055 RepID=A0AAV1RFU2_9ROSI|nr:unnamed protein product [Dovyalis caffra]